MFPAFGRRLGFNSRCPGVLNCKAACWWCLSPSCLRSAHGVASRLGPCWLYCQPPYHGWQRCIPVATLGPSLHSLLQDNSFYKCSKAVKWLLSPLMASGFVRLSQWAFINSILPAWDGKPCPGLARPGQGENRKWLPPGWLHG